MRHPSPNVEHPEFQRLVRLTIGRGMPGVVVGATYDGIPALRVNDKPFASLREVGEMVLRCAHDRKEMLLELAPDIYSAPPNFDGWPMLLVRLEAIGDEELAGRLEEAWRLKAPKRLSREWPG